MKQLIIKGAVPLSGSVTVSGAKNSALPVLFAAYLVASRSVLCRLPAIGDVRLACEMLEHSGAQISKTDEHTCLIDTSACMPGKCPDAFVRRMRGSVYLLGAELGRFGYSKCPLPGGCDFGHRPIDQHLKAFRCLGAEVNVEGGYVCVRADRLRGAQIDFDTVSVGATVNAILAAVRAEGKTVITGASAEPHIADLAQYLNACGASVSGAGTSVLEIYGRERLHGAAYEIGADTMEAGTFLLAALATKGGATVCGVKPEEMRELCDVLKRMGAEVTMTENSVSVRYTSPLRSTDIITAPYPAFPTDLHPQMAALLSVCHGVGSVTDTVWSKRFRYAEQLAKAGADIEVCSNKACIRGVQSLRPSGMEVPDLRAGAAVTIAALSAQGTSVIYGADIIARGYENFGGKLRTLGADVIER